MKILLVEPPMQSFMLARADWFPMGITYLAGSAKREGHEVLIYNGEHDPNLDYLNLTTYSDNYHLYVEALNDYGHSTWKKFSKVMGDFKPDILGITGFSVKWTSAQRIASLGKDFDPNMPVIMGGQHASIMTDSVLKNPNIDFVARGEGEETLIEFLREVEGEKNWKNVDGLSFKNEGIHHNQSRELLKDLDQLAFPARECLYDIENYSPQSLAKLFSSRGCPFKCTYCGTQNIWTYELRHHSPRRIVEEIEHVKKQYHETYFTFFDDVFAINKKQVMKLLDTMIESKVDINWDCLTRAHLVSDKLLSKMKQAGCKKIDIGVESGSDKVLLDTQKGMTVKQLEKGAKLIQKHKIFLYCFLMIGLPTENEEDVQMTKDFLMRVKPDWAGISIFTPIPGTKAYKDLEAQGKIPKEPEFEKFSHQSPNSNFAFNMENRDNFPKLAQDMIEFVQAYNGSWRNLFRRALTRGYLKNPGLIFYDLKKVLTWKGLLKASHQGSHAKFYSKAVEQ